MKTQNSRQEKEEMEQKAKQFFREQAKKADMLGFDSGWEFFKQSFSANSANIKIPLQVVEDMNQRLVEIKRVGSNLQLFYHFGSPTLGVSCDSASIYTKSIDKVNIKPVLTEAMYDPLSCIDKFRNMMHSSASAPPKTPRDFARLFWIVSLLEAADEYISNYIIMNGGLPTFVEEFNGLRVNEDPQNAEEILTSALAMIRDLIKTDVEALKEKAGDFLEVSVSYSGASMPLLVCSNMDHANRVANRMKSMLDSDNARLVDTYTAADVGSPVQIINNTSWHARFGRFNNILQEYMISTGLVERDEVMP